MLETRKANYIGWFVWLRFACFVEMNFWPTEKIKNIYPLYKIICDEVANNILYNLNIPDERVAFCNSIIANIYNVFNSCDNLIAVCDKCHDSIYHSSGWKKQYDEIDNQQPSQNILEGSETIETAQ